MCFLQLFCAFCCFVDASPRFCCAVPLCCATSAVVRVTFAPPVRLYLVFLRACVVSAWCFFEVAVYFLLLLLLLSPVVSCFLASVVLWFVSSWFRGLLGVLLLRVWFVCVVSLVGVLLSVLVLVCFG